MRTGTVTQPPVDASVDVTAEAHFIAACANPKVLACRDFNSVEDVVRLNSTGVPNSPGDPRDNGKCLFNGGDRKCFPTFLEGNCGKKDQLLASIGRGQSTILHASLYSPCFDSIAKAARLTYWNDLGSSIQQLQIAKFPPSNLLNAQNIWIQYEIMFSSEFFFDTGSSNTAKLLRLDRKKTGTECRDFRFADHRLGTITPDGTRISAMFYCKKKYVPSRDFAAEIAPSLAGHWLRVTTNYEVANDAVGFWVKDLKTGAVLSNSTIIVDRDGEPLDFNSKPNVHGIRFLVHSTSHKPAEGVISPHFWVRHAIVSTGPISH